MLRLQCRYDTIAKRARTIQQLNLEPNKDVNTAKVNTDIKNLEPNENICLNWLCDVVTSISILFKSLYKKKYFLKLFNDNEIMTASKEP